ncbi:ABC transporter substrate-binding protein [Litorilinea aerophila]|uniref:ABC transporter substrate-binding protein n=1 Tax=Litorilinea aerophila TaxID=1204385 RepID=A0A540VFR1_9CHLR|nr:ABC transporter substrate-binding protein [Litorilinea aerophila]MCC9076591.1 ABC transporter substrate-binding protein [Litorilinea aerophila]
MSERHEPRTLSRRMFMRLSAFTAAGTVLAACGGGGTPEAAPPAAEATTAPAAGEGGAAASAGAAPSQYNEAPMLAELVAQGQLPPVDERLPKNPRVIPVVEEIGEYGGTWFRAAVGPGDAGILNSRLSYENLVRWSQDGSTVVPNVAESFEINDTATEFTIKLREGMRWSDGEPFTADDFVFWYEDVLLNTDLTPSIPSWMRDPVTGEVGKLEKIDDYTIKFSFPNPYGLFIQILAGPSAGAGGNICDYPKHYLSQFHPNYVSEEELAQKTQDAGFDNWWELFGNKRNWQNPEQPHIWPWIPTRVPPDVPVVAERNPYYYKVDPEGNQLPYLDKVQFDIVENADLLNLKAVAGEIDCQFRHILWNNYPLFIDNAEQGDYRVFRWKLAEGSNCLLHPNMNHKDPVLRELFQNKNFRIALSLGIDRTQINELAYQGFGQPRQASLIPESPYFKEEHATRYAEHDPDRANQLLDEIGLTERDSEGFRLRPDGEPLTITIEYAPVFGPWRDAVQMITDQWKQIGIRAIPKEEDRTLFSQRGLAGEEMDMGVWIMDRCLTPLIEPWYFLPYQGGTPPSTAALWWQWYQSRGEQGEEPPAEVKRQYELYDLIKGASPDELPALAEEFFDNASENIWFIGTVGVLPHVGIVKNNFRNVPEEAVSDWLQQTPGNTNVEQYFKRSS